MDRAHWTVRSTSRPVELGSAVNLAPTQENDRHRSPRDTLALSASTPPRPVITVLRVEQQQGHYLVRLRVDNLGERTAARLKVQGTLSGRAGLLEQSETEFDYVPGRSSREAGLFFRNDPRSHALDVAPRSYQQP